MKKRKIIIIILILFSTILLICGLILLTRGKSPVDNDVNKFETKDAENDLINMDNYYLERSDSKVKDEHTYGDFTFYDVTFSGSNKNYLFQGVVKNNGQMDVETISFNIQFLDYDSNVKFEYSGVTSFDLKSKIAIMHIETTKNIALYYDYKITDIKIN